jgi:hypothetical protein
MFDEEPEEFVELSDKARRAIEIEQLALAERHGLNCFLFLGGRMSVDRSKWPESLPVYRGGVTAGSSFEDPFVGLMLLGHLTAYRERLVGLLAEQFKATPETIEELAKKLLPKLELTQREDPPESPSDN